MKCKRIIATILTFSLILSPFPQISFAAGEEDTIYYSPVELWSLLDIGYNNYKTPLGEINPNAPSSVIKVFNAKDDINNNANVYPQYQSFKDNATGELKNISYRSYLNLKGYDLRKWCTGWSYPSISYNYPLEKTLPEAISSQWYKNYAASYSFSLDGSRVYDYDYSSDIMEIIPNTYSNTTNMVHKRDFMMAVPYEAFSLYEKKSSNDIANTHLVGVTTVTSQTDSWVRYGYTDTSIDGWKSVISGGMNYGEQISFYGTGETRNNCVNRAKFQNIGVYLRDIQGPKVTKVSFTKTDPLVKPIWDAETSNEYNTNDSYLYISLKLDEPVKFKDSYATVANQENLKNMGLVFNTIGVDGSSGQDKTAKFYRYTPAQNDPTPTMVFKYKLPANEYFRISEINIDDSKNHDFFSNLTDVAGNQYNMNVNNPNQAVSQRFVLSELPVVDTQKPTLLTPDMSSSRGDAYLNTGSILTVNVNFSELMKTSNVSTGLNNSLLFNSRGNVANIAAVTNLKDSSGNDVLLLPSENMSGPWEYYEIFNGKYSVRKVGSINAPDSSTISLGYKIPEGCYLPEGESFVKVTGIKQLVVEVVDGIGLIKRENGIPVTLPDIQIEDINSNMMDLSNLSSAQQMKVDSYKPVLEVSEPLEADGTTKITTPKQTLYFKVTADDKQTGKYNSGFAGQTASFYFGTEAYYGYPKAGFDYAVSSSTTIDAWTHTDADNATIHFPLMDSQEDYYIAIKLADKSVLERINYSCSISDNAGSSSSMSKTDYAYALDIAEPLLTILDEPKLIGRADGTKYFNVGVYARDDSDFSVQYVWKDRAVNEDENTVVVEPDWATDADVKLVTLGQYDWHDSNINYTSRYGNATLELTEKKCWSKRLWIRAVDKNGLATTTTNITGFVGDTRAANIDVVPLTPTDKLVTGKPVAKIHIDPAMSEEDKEATLISYRWVVEKRPNALTWAEDYFYTPPSGEPEIRYYVPQQEENQWITTSASAIAFDSNGDFELTASDMRYNFTSNNDLWGTWDNSIPVNGDVTLYVKSQINYTTAYKTVTFKVSDTANNSMALGNDIVGLYLKTNKFNYDENTKTETQEAVYFNTDDNIIKLDENDRMQAEIAYEFKNCNEYWGARQLSRELVDFESPDTKLELVRFKIKDEYKNDPKINGTPVDLIDNKYTRAIRSTTTLDALTADMYTEEVVYSEKITESQLKETKTSDNYLSYFGVSVDLPAYLFKSAIWKEGDPLEVYGIRTSLARKPIYDIALGKNVQPTPIVDEKKNIIIDNTPIEQGSISIVKNKNEDTKAVASDLKAKAASIVAVTGGSVTTYKDETVIRDRIYVSEEYPEITFRTMGAFFEGRLADVKNYNGTSDRYYGRNVARVSVGNDISNGNIRYKESHPRYSMPVNKAVTTKETTDTYKAYEYTVNGVGTYNPEIGGNQIQLNPGENIIYYQFVGSNGTQSPINTITIVLDESKPDIVFKALPAPTDENPDLVTNAEVIAGVDYAIDSIVCLDGSSTIGTPSDKIVTTSEAYYGDTVPGTFSYDEADLTAPKKNADGTFTFKKNGNIVATATDELGNSTTENYKIDWIDTQAPDITAFDQSGTDKINLTATYSDDRSANKVSLAVTFDDAYTQYLLGVDTLTEDNRWFSMSSDSMLQGLISSSASNGTAALQAYIKTGDNSPVPTKATLKATDLAGNSSTEEITLAGIVAPKPVITASSYNSADGFTITFNQPVKLKNLTSDANIAAIYTAEAIHKKVSIYADGNYQVTYTDVFGQERSETITAEIFGIAYKHSVMLSNSRPTLNSVTVTLDATMTEGIYLQLTDGALGTIKKTGLTTVNSTEVYKKVEITLDTNKTFTYNLISSGNISPMTATFSLTNIDKLAPVANYFRKVEGTEILEADGSKTITGTVSYQILGFNEENVVMAEGSPSTYTFDKSGEHTFVFTDEAGNEGKLTVMESGAFIPKSVEDDTTPPDYSLSYCAEGSEMLMLNSADNQTYISGTYKPAFEKVSGDVMVDIKIIDDNPVTMTVLSDGSGVAKYVVGQLGLTFTDNGTAQVRLTDAKNNSTTVNIKVECIDKTAPTGVINYEVQADRTVIAYLERYSEDATVLNSPGMQYNDTLKKYYYHFTGNGTSVFTLQDEAGNLGNLVAKVVSIDIAAPEILKGNTTWIPSALNDINSAPTGIKTNSNVTVFFLMNELISAVEIGVVNPSGITDISPYISYSFAATSVTVEFKQNCQISMTLTDLAGNKSKVFLIPEGTEPLSVIDKAAPELVTGSQTVPNPGIEILSNKATYTYTFNEPVRIVSEAGSDYAMNFKKTYDSNGNVSHTFADEAGNTMTTTVNVDQLDLTAPSFNYKIKATEGDSAIGNTGVNTTNKPVTVIITPSEDCTLTIGRRDDRIKSTYDYIAGALSLPIEYTISTNGIYEINIVDAAGNKSTGQIYINFIDTEAPRITLPTGSSYNLVQNANASDTDLVSVLAGLSEGVTANDSIDGVCEVSLSGLTVNDLKTEGDYTVTFTAVDKVGNTGTATRKVKVYSSQTAFFKINNKDAASSAVTTLYERLIAITQPEAIKGAYKLSYKKGYQTIAQMKYGATAIKDNTFTAGETGYYTILVQSTDRISYVTYIYVAK